MTDKERIARTKIITLMFTCFGQGGDADRIVAYVNMLEGIPVEMLDSVCNKTVYECKYLPSISEIIMAAKNLQGEITGTKTVPFAEAWEEILQQLHDTCEWEQPKFSRKEITQLVKAFGWNELRYMETRNMTAIRAQMRDMYNAICEENNKTEINNYVSGKDNLLGNERVKQLC